MNEQHIARLEAEIERLIEGTFARLFGRRLRAQDIALQVARAMEDGIFVSNSGQDTRPTAPDRYDIHLNPLDRAQLLDRQPSLLNLLADHVLELATSSGFQLVTRPTIDLISDLNLSLGEVVVKANHSNRKASTTAIMKRVELPKQQEGPSNPQLILNGRQTIRLSGEVINVGRSRENHVVLDDRMVSRYHLQIRLRNGQYMVFDANSQSGTLVNDVRVREHRLQSGDVIRIGNTQLIYVDDHVHRDGQTGQYLPDASDPIP